MTDKIVEGQINIMAFSYRKKLIPLKSVVAKEIITNIKATDFFSKIGTSSKSLFAFLFETTEHYNSSLLALIQDCNRA